MHLIVTPDRNTKKSDYTGAFKLEAIEYRKLWGGDIVTFDASLPLLKRRDSVIKALTETPGKYDHVVFMCHGWSKGIQAGFTTKNVKELAVAICKGNGPRYISSAVSIQGQSMNIVYDYRVALYCCSTGADPQDDSMEAPGTAPMANGNLGDNSFGDLLRDELCKAGAAECSVFAHTTAGHTTQNPNIILFEGAGSNVGGYGGVMPITPKDKKTWARWAKQLKTKYRFHVPYESVAELRANWEAIA
jgi:hypothetical protein